jgi:hypothetical protein
MADAKTSIEGFNPPKHCKKFTEIMVIDSINGQLYFQCKKCGYILVTKW